MSSSRNASRVFLQAVLRRPSLIGGVWPSSPALAARLASVIPGSGDPVVVELGAGSGAVSDGITARLGARGRYLAVELDEELAGHLRENYPRMEVLNANATELGKLLADRGVEAVDSVVSGLPWALIGEDGQREILGHVAEALHPHGVFTTFAYVHALGMENARKFRRLLEATFDEVLLTRVVWANLPPAITYVCRRPR